MNNDEETPKDLLDDLTAEEDALNRKLSQVSPLDTSSLGSHELDYDDDEASTDEEDVAAVQGDMVMAERTNQLMTDFRTYINDIQGGGATSNGGAATTTDVNVDAEYGEHYETKLSTSGKHVPLFVVVKTKFTVVGVEVVIVLSWLAVD